MTGIATPTSTARSAVDDAGLRRQLRTVWRYLRWLGADPALADDLAQDAFVLLLQRPPADASEPAVAAWLRTTATNLFRSTGRRARLGVPLDRDEVLEAVWRDNAGDDGGDRYHEALAACLRLLPDRTRQAVELRYRHELDDAALAGAIGLRPGGVKTLLRRARELLAECIRTKVK